ncbi:protein CHROMOSOME TRANSMISSION FIDELITY 7 [Neltuma alba]|uniref:protein CHROMOSOME TRANSMISSION FIDELITY 7 n=1 Tax=Neltuma alba TaxID=207710 RepID=UPI0010A2FF97|nr:protein CHROMOSOME TRANSMISSION FIDELITY 7 [Prosopis alba]
MQSKISSFFKSPAHAPKSIDPASVIDGGDDELAIWEKKEHHIFNTYERRRSVPKIIQGNTGEIHQAKKIIPVESCSKPESIITGRTIIKNKKRSYAQFHLDCGQSDFLLHNCSTCGVKFAPGDVEDEKAHKEFHKTYTRGLSFKGWTNERVVHMPNVKGDRIILVLESDPLAQKNKVEEFVKMMEIDLGTGWIIHQYCKVYLFISQQRIVGCLVAEPIKEAFKVISCSVAGSSDGSRKKETNSFSTTLHFGDVIFRREVEKRTSSVTESAELYTTHGGAIFCDDKAVTAVCGIRAIWVTSSNRRKGVATQLLDAVRKSFCMGFVLDHSQLAFSQPTSVGMALASSYTGTGSFSVYRANKTES